MLMPAPVPAPAFPLLVGLVGCRAVPVLPAFPVVFVFPDVPAFPVVVVCADILESAVSEAAATTLRKIEFIFIPRYFLFSFPGKIAL